MSIIAVQLVLNKRELLRKLLYDQVKSLKHTYFLRARIIRMIIIHQVCDKNKSSCALVQTSISTKYKLTISYM